LFVGVSAVAKMESISQLSHESVNDSIVSLFECPVCYEYLTPPIYQCKNAHNICSKCKEHITKCPTCGEIYLDSRSVFVEQIAERLLYPCKNLEVGCYEKYSLQDIEKHHEVCSHRMYECLPGKADNCKWKGRSFDILTHMMDAHASSCWMVDENNILYDYNVFEGVEDLQLVSAYHEVFWYNFKCDATKQKLFLAVQYIGPQELACTFTYEFELCADTDEEKSIIIKNRTRPDTEKLNDIYDSASCIVLDFATVKHFVDSNNSVSFCLRLKRVMAGDSTDGIKDR
jgi:E3 ubiquitin-protein ligase SIAH1